MTPKHLHYRKRHTLRLGPSTGTTGASHHRAFMKSRLYDLCDLLRRDRRLRTPVLAKHTDPIRPLSINRLCRTDTVVGETLSCTPITCRRHRRQTTAALGRTAYHGVWRKASLGSGIAHKPSWHKPHLFARRCTRHNKVLCDLSSRQNQLMAKKC